jgi:hypothetical protein
MLDLFIFNKTINGPHNYFNGITLVNYKKTRVFGDNDLKNKTLAHSIQGVTKAKCLFIK